MKAVLISIQPKWVEKIANGEKTIEVRKTAPKCEEPFKCYIYCTKTRDNEIYKRYKVDDIKSGKVIGEFVCDSAEWMSMRDCDKACMTLKEAVDYSKGKKLYAWHISDLKIYDKPKELSEFFTPMGKRPSYMVERPPQSWQYVEE
jgi:predicted transcriptional regulator